MGKRNRAKRTATVANEAELIAEELPTTPFIEVEPSAPELGSPSKRATAQAPNASGQTRLVELVTSEIVKLAARGLTAAERTLLSAAEWLAQQARNVDAVAARLR